MFYGTVLHFTIAFPPHACIGAKDIPLIPPFLPYSLTLLAHLFTHSRRTATASTRSLSGATSGRIMLARVYGRTMMPGSVSKSFRRSTMPAEAPLLRK